MIAASLAGCIGGEDVDTSDYENQIAEKDKSIDELESIIINQNEQLNNSVNNVSMLQAQLEQSISYRDDLLSSLNQSNISVNELNQQLNTLNQSIVELQSTLLESQSLAADWQTIAEANEFELTNLDMSNFDLSGYDFTGVTMDNVDLTGANLQGALMEHSNLGTIRAVELVNCPSTLPIGWICYQNILFGPNANLSNLDLTNLDFGWQFDGFDLSMANLTNSDLSYSDLSGLDISNANLHNLRATNLLSYPYRIPTEWSTHSSYESGDLALIGPYANASLLDFQSGWLLGNLTGINLSYANISSTIVEARLDYAVLDGANLDRAYFVDADFFGLRGIGVENCSTVSSLPHEWICIHDTLMGPNANLARANLSGLTIVSQTNLSGADLSYANLENTDLSYVKLVNANMQYASLDGANLEQADIYCTDFRYAKVGIVSGDVYRSGCSSSYGWEFDEPFSEWWILSEYDVHGFLFAPPLRIITGPYIDYSGMSIPTGFTGENMSYSSFDFADFLYTTEFDQVDLIGATFNQTDLGDVEFSRSNLTGAIFNQVDFTDVIWSDTICPDGTNSYDNGDTCENNLLP